MRDILRAERGTCESKADGGRVSACEAEAATRGGSKPCWLLLARVRAPCHRSGIVCFRRAMPRCPDAALPPAPVADFWHVVAVPEDVLLVVDQLVAQRLLEMRRACPRLAQPLASLAGRVQALPVLAHRH